MKVLEVIADPSLSGAPRHVLALSGALRGLRVEPTVVCPEGWLGKEAKKVGLKVKSIPMRGIFDVKSIFALRKFIRQERPDVIHFHGIRTGGIGVLATLFLKFKKVYTEHLYTLEYHLKNPFRELLQIASLFIIARLVDRVICPSSAVKEFMIGKIKLAERKVRVVLNGLADYKIELKNTDSKTIGFIGSINAQKGLPYLVMAFGEVLKKIPEAKLEIIGEGPLKEEAEKMAARHQDKIKFIGQVELISPYMTKWRAVVIPSVSESFGQVAVEAAVAGLPVIASSVGGLPEVVKDGKTGILVKSGDVSELEKTIVNVLRDEEGAKKMGEQARQYFLNNFTAKIMAEKISQIYENS